MTKTILLLMAVFASAVLVTQSASVSITRGAWRANKGMSAAAGTQKARPAFVSVKWLPDLFLARRFHPAPEPDEEFAVPSRRKFKVYRSALYISPLGRINQSMGFRVA